MEVTPVMSVKFKFNKTARSITQRLRDDLFDVLSAAKEQYSEFLYEELRRTSPVASSTFQHSWIAPKETKMGYEISNILPSRYIASGGKHHAWEPIVDPYNLYILEGDKAGAPLDYYLTENMWEYRNIGAGKLQDVTILLWKFNQGALGLNPYTILNQLFAKKVRRNI